MRFLFALICSFISLFVFAENYYWYNGNKVELLLGNKEYVVYKSKIPTRNIDSIQLCKDEFAIASENDTLKWGIFVNGQRSNYLDSIDVLYQSPSYIMCKDSTEVFITDEINIKLLSENDISLLNEIASEYRLDIQPNAYLPDWYVLKCTPQTKYNALEIANILYESGKFEVSEPNFLETLSDNCVNDPKFNKQWNLNNVGNNGYTAGIDIKYCDANTITSGNAEIVVAVYDSGIDLSHPDLNLHSTSYDVYTNAPQTDSRASRHGTASAGIIGAISDNYKGVAGIASSCPIMSICRRDDMKASQVADGFYFAADNGCAVISCSWECSPESATIDSAIVYAMKHGRDGLGSLVVFGAGNANDSVSYPANSNNEIIVVGAISPCGERKSLQSCDEEDWGSNYGSQLDIVAPGVMIPTTDLRGAAGASPNNYRNDYNGTSAACPHVSAVAALVLSINPGLTREEVTNIIEFTAQRVGDYDYSIEDGHPNGRWHKEMGYGLVDAYAAVLAAQPKYIQNQIYQTGEEVYEYAPEITAGYAVTDSEQYGNVICEAGSEVLLRAMDRIRLKPGFHAQSGSKVHIVTDSWTYTPSDPAISAPQRIAPRSSSASADDTEQTDKVSTTNALENIESEMIQSTAIYTISGQLLQTIEGGQRDAAHLPNGMYILQHRMSDGSMKSDKITNYN